MVEKNEIPPEVWEWLKSNKAPFLFILYPGFDGDNLAVNDDPEAVKAALRGYNEYMQMRLKEWTDTLPK